MIYAIALCLIAAAFFVGNAMGYGRSERHFLLAILSEATELEPEVEERFQDQINAAREGRN